MAVAEETHISLESLALPADVTPTRAPPIDPEGPIKSFVVSNEADFFKSKIDRRPADAFVAFGNNNAWDLAMRRNAKALVLADIDTNVLKAQEFIYKPLIMLAKNRAEFISFLGGIPLPTELRDSKKISEVFSYVAEKQKEIHSTGRIPAEVSDFISDIRTRILSERSLSKQHADLVTNHLQNILKYSPEQMVELFELNKHVPDILKNPSSPGHSGLMRFEGRSNLFGYFAYRYDTEWTKDLFGEDFNSSNHNNDDFSVLSSDKSFAWLKRIFTSGNVFYAPGNILDAKWYSSVGKFLFRKGFSVSALSVSNIPDFIAAAKIGPDRKNVLKTISENAARHFPLEGDVVIYESRGTRMNHEFVESRIEYKKRPSLFHLNGELSPAKTWRGKHQPSRFSTGRTMKRNNDGAATDTYTPTSKFSIRKTRRRK